VIVISEQKDLVWLAPYQRSISLHCHCCYLLLKKYCLYFLTKRVLSMMASELVYCS